MKKKNNRNIHYKLKEDNDDYFIWTILKYFKNSFNSASYQVCYESKKIRSPIYSFK
jgi:hypothetical protein